MMSNYINIACLIIHGTHPKQNDYYKKYYDARQDEENQQYMRIDGG